MLWPFAGNSCIQSTIDLFLNTNSTSHFVNNNNNRFLYSAFPNYDQSASQCIITPVIGFRHNSALKVHFLHSLGSIPASRRFIGAHVPTQPQFRSHPTGSPFNTWVESSNVDKVSCWRTKVPCESGNRTRTLSVRVERSLHYTTAPPQYILLQIHTCVKFSASKLLLQSWRKLIAPHEQF